MPMYLQSCAFVFEKHGTGCYTTIDDILYILMRAHLSLVPTDNPTMTFASMRCYLALPPRQLPADVLQDAFVCLDAGALYLVEQILESRVNRRTRRTLQQASAEYAKPADKRGAWFVAMQGSVWSLYRLLLEGGGH